MLQVEDGRLTDENHVDDLRDHSIALALLNIQFYLHCIYNVINAHIAIHDVFELEMVEMYPEFFHSLEPLYECFMKWKKRLDDNCPECRR